jgi:SAM-dependent methyltransferase
VVLNVGSGEDARAFGSRTVRVDRYAPNVTVRANLRNDLPFQNETFQAVVCTEVLEHVPRPQELLREIARVMKPGAQAVITVPFFFHYHPDPDDFVRFTPAGLRSAMESAGLTVEFLAGSGRKVTAALLLTESVHPVAKVVIRTLLLPFAPLMARQRPVNGRWSDCAANVVAIARKPAHADS